MIEFLKSHGLEIIGTLINLLGLFFTYKGIKNDINDSIIKFQKNNNVEKLQNIIPNLYDLMDINTINNKDKSLDLLKDIHKCILTYGTKTDMDLLTKMQRETYKKDKANNKILLACICLLIKQIKYEVSGTIMNDDEFFKLKITDYSPEQYAEEINLISKECNVCK